MANTTYTIKSITKTAIAIRNEPFLLVTSRLQCNNLPSKASRRKRRRRRNRRRRGGGRGSTCWVSAKNNYVSCYNCELVHSIENQTRTNVKAGASISTVQLSIANESMERLRRMPQYWRTHFRTEMNIEIAARLIQLNWELIQAGSGRAATPAHSQLQFCKSFRATVRISAIFGACHWHLSSLKSIYSGRIPSAQSMRSIPSARY